MAETGADIEKTLGLGRHRSHRAGWAIGLAVVLGLGVGAWYFIGGDRQGNGVRYVTAEAMIADFSVTVTATGTVEPTNLVEISSELSGTIREVMVDYNDEVEVGTILAELDTTKLEAQLAVSRAALDAATARVATARATLDEAIDRFERMQDLEGRGIASHQEFVTARATYIRAQSSLQSAMADQALAEANLALQQADLDKTCICSPIKGVVLDRQADAGQIVASALSAPVLFTVAEDLTQMELRVDIDEADIGLVAVGNPATFTVDAYDERVFPAEITEVRYAPETVDGVVTYKAILTIDNSALLLRPGMTATAEITVAQVADALSVPNAALRYAPPLEAAPDDEERSGLLGMLIPSGPEDRLQADSRTVWVLRDGVADEIPLRTGLSDGQLTEVLEGELSPGDRVVTDRIDG